MCNDSLWILLLSHYTMELFCLTAITYEESSNCCQYSHHTYRQFCQVEARVGLNASLTHSKSLMCLPIIRFSHPHCSPFFVKPSARLFNQSTVHLLHLSPFFFCSPAAHFLKVLLTPSSSAHSLFGNRPPPGQNFCSSFCLPPSRLPSFHFPPFFIPSISLLFSLFSISSLPMTIDFIY